MTSLFASVPTPDTLEATDALSSTSSSSSSSAWSFIPGIGVLAAVVEHAISRWARRDSFTPSTSSSSTASYPRRSSSSPFSHTRGFGRRRRARSASAASEREVATRLRARQVSRHIPREFTLYLPPELAVADRHGLAPSPGEAVIRASSLPHVLGAIKKASKLRRGEGTVRPVDPSSSSLNRGTIFPDRASVAALRKRNGKQREDNAPWPVSALWPTHRGRSPKAWWLDVANPTWDDMRTIGKLLHLHPLTLEDILQQDTREKLELFPRLGYQFIVFRASESAGTPKRFQERSEVGSREYECSEGLIREANIYLVVFREGICTFHFSDISDHMERVRGRLQLLRGNFHMSSDWIAHGILDSVVDSFFPILKEIEKEVAAMEAVIFADAELVDSYCAACPSTANPEDRTSAETEKSPIDSLGDKAVVAAEPTSRIPVLRLTFPLVIHHNIRKITAFLKDIWAPRTSVTSSQAATTTTLRRMTRTRRLVTSLTRLLASKSEVVSQTRKRYLTIGKFATSDDPEIAMYMGDVQDHILTLQQALTHYEDILGESHSAYLTQLRMNMSNVRSRSDKAVFILTLVGLGVVTPTPIIGIFSMNVHTPRNTIYNPIPSGGHYWFGIVLALVFFVECSFLAVVRYWWVQAKKYPKSKSL